MRILIIGGSGRFIGARVVDELAGLGHQIGVFARPGAAVRGGVRRFVGDRRRISDHAAELRAFAPEVVVDVILGSEAHARALVDTFRGVAQRIVAISSMDVYRSCGVLHRLEPGPLEPLPLTEASPLRTRLQTYPPAQIAMLQHLFGWLDQEYDKIPVERALLADKALPATVLRLPMVYGPGDKLHRFFPLLKRMDDGRAAILMAEDLAAWRGTKGYVNDVAAAIAAATVSDRAAGRIYNVGEANVRTELEWARAVATITGWRGNLVTLPMENMPAHLQTPANFQQHWVADTTRIREETGFSERVDRDEALRRTIEWERANPPADINLNQFDYAAEDAVIASRT